MFNEYSIGILILTLVSCLLLYAIYGLNHPKDYNWDNSTQNYEIVKENEQK